MSVTDGQHKVPIAIHRPAPSRLPARGTGAPEQGCRRRGPLQPGAEGPSRPGVPEPGARSPTARRVLGGGAPACRLWRAAEADTRITLLQAPGAGMRAQGGVGGCADRFPLPTLSAGRLYKLIWSKKKIIEKTYKITIEKVILLGKAPLRLRGGFRSFSKAVSLPPREYSLLAKSLAASWGSGRVAGSRPWAGLWSSACARTLGTCWGWGKVPGARVAFSFWSLWRRMRCDPGSWCPETI